MRDIYFVIVFVFLIYMSLRRPFIALGLCVWSALFFPNAWLYGFASVVRYNLAFFVLTAISLIFYKGKDLGKNHLGSVFVCVIMFFLWTVMSSLFNDAYTPIVFDVLSRFSKVVLVSILLMLLLKKFIHIEFILYMVVLSIGFYSFIEGLKYVASGGGHGISGLPGHSLGDRNELAVAFAMTIPIIVYLLKYPLTGFRFEKLAMLSFLFFLVASIIGTDSRGGFIALMFVYSYTLMKSQNRIFLLLASCIGAAVIYSYIPDDWFRRMDTIESADNDLSFMGRVVAWKLSYIMALDHPILGGGFKAIEFFPNWQYYTQYFGNYEYFYTGNHVPNPSGAHAAHSIYFQVLGDHGFVGLMLFLTMIVTTLVSTKGIEKTLKKKRIANFEQYIALSSTLRISIVAYLLGGAALSFAYFDLFYVLIALVVVLRNVVEREVANERIDIKTN